MSIGFRLSSLKVCSRACLALSSALVIGCAGFKLPPYPEVVQDVAARTQTVQRNRPAAPPNRAANLAGHSQAEIKSQLQQLWQPSYRIRAWANYNGLIATRQSKMVTQPGPQFRAGDLEVQHLGQTVGVSYIAAFHPGKRLPLVVAVSGIDGTVDGKVTLDILHGLYNSGEFHVMHLESLTSINHQMRNQQTFAGGFPEGVLLYKTLAALRSRPELAGQIDQVHLLGVSYGGLLCGIAAYCEGVFQTGALDGAVLAFSPPIDLKMLFQNLGVIRLIHNRVLQDYVVDGYERYIQYLDLGLTEPDLAELDFDPYWRKICFPCAQRIYPRLKQDFPDLPPLRDPDDLYAISSLRPLLGRLTVPFFFVHAYDDPVVSPEDHFHQVLAQCPNPLVEGMLVHDGGHLGFDAVCGYPFSASVAETYFRYWTANRALSGTGP